MNDKEFLQWIYDRLYLRYGERENLDYMHKFRAIIAATDKTKFTPNICSEVNHGTAPNI